VLVAIPLFDRFTALDAVGPYEVLSRLPGVEIAFVAEHPGPVRADTGWLALVADRSLDEVERCDVVVVPGGPGTRDMLEPGPLHRWITRVDQRTAWTTSVCTGSLVLGAAGLLDGLEATTHWSARDLLAGLGARPVDQRIVVQGKVVTAAGVSAGLDMALWLAAQMAGDTVAQAIQLGIEYDPQPPFNAGSPATAPLDVVQLVARLSTERRDATSA
jgi:transcriptional regulator GlxA family with amidase domain